MYPTNEGSPSAVSITLVPSVLDYFKCPDQILNFAVEAGLSAQPGFFRFGKNTVCYGRCSNDGLSRESTSNLPDVSENVRTNGTGVVLPFDPEEIIRNLRQERYAANCVQYRQNQGLVRGIYYLLRPWMPLSLRKCLQRIYLRGWDKLSFPKWPVDSTVDHLVQQLMILALKASDAESIPFIWFWPDGASACALMTHDVEAEAGKHFCAQLMDIDDSFNVPASFQIVPEARYSVEPEFLEQIRNRGFEINVQDLNHDGRLFHKRTEFEKRMKMINRYGREYKALGFRSAVLYRNQEWFDQLEFEYDMSVPSVAHLDPQRGGCCTVMPYFVGDFLELPVTTTQDHSLFNILRDFTTTLWQKQIAFILQHHGLMNFIVHPDYILGQRAQDVFKQLLGLLAKMRTEDNVWLTLPRDVNRWWRQRRQMTLTRKNGEWCIEGEGSERARLAFASVQGDRLVYSFAPKPIAADLLKSDTNSGAGAAGDGGTDVLVQ